MSRDAQLDVKCEKALEDFIRETEVEVILQQKF